MLFCTLSMLQNLREAVSNRMFCRKLHGFFPELRGILVVDICRKSMHFATKASAPRPAAGGVNVAVRASSVENHIPHALTQLRLARSHARHARHEHETKQKQISRLRILPPNLRFSCILGFMEDTGCRKSGPQSGSLPWEVGIT